MSESLAIIGISCLFPKADVPVVQFSLDRTQDPLYHYQLGQQLKELREDGVLIVSSGGPISTAIGHILGTVPEKTIELNMQIRNSAVTEFLFTPKRHLLLTFNSLAHLDGAEYAPWITYS